MANPIIGLNRIRLLIDINNPEKALLNLTESAAPELINGEGTQFELMCYSSAGNVLFSDATTITDWSNINSVVVALQDTPIPHESKTFWSAQIAQGAIVQNCTVANWNTGLSAPSGTTQQMLITVPGSSLILAMNGQTQTTWLVIYALTTDANPNPICLAAFQVSVFDAGIPIGLGIWWLMAPDGLVHPVTLAFGNQGQLQFKIGAGVSGASGISAPYLVAPDGTYRLPTLHTVNGITQITLA